MKEFAEPLIRNNYYYGKLLTVEDFKLEQMYLMKKINLLSRLLIQEGVIKGLGVSIEDSSRDKLDLEAGLCMDDLGRIIIVPEKRKIALSDINGSDSLEDGDEALIGIRYKERFKGESLALNQDNISKDDKVYDQIIEDYELVVWKKDYEVVESCVRIASVLVRVIGSGMEIELIDV